MSEFTTDPTVWKYCPKCGEPLNLVEHDGQQVPKCTSRVCGFIFWQNSKPCAVAIILNKEKQVLMTERAIEPERGKLDLPGGFLNHGEDPIQGLKREIREELGVEIETLDTVGHFIDAYGLAENVNLIIGFHAAITNGEPKALDRDEIARLEWVDVMIEPQRLAFTNNARFLELLKSRV